MSRLINLLNEKNHYLEKFYSHNETELVNFLNGNFETIQVFYETREKILEMIKYIDSEISKIAHEDNIKDHISKQIRECIRIKDMYVERILAQDLQVLSCIEAAKNSIIQELQEIRKGKKVVSKYKSPTFFHRVDEEA